MKTNGIITLMVGLWLAGCSSGDLALTPAVTPAPNEDVSALYQQFHGRYKVISSTSDKELDVNVDGNASADMMLEIPELATGPQYYLQLNIYGPSKNSPKPSFIYSQWWPEQYIRLGSKEWDGGQLLDYNPDYRVAYLTQGSFRSLSFSSDLKQIIVNPSQNENPFRWVLPESVTVENNGRLRVVNKRRLYTSAGVKEVLITTVYERFTMST